MGFFDGRRRGINEVEAVKQESPKQTGNTTDFQQEQSYEEPVNFEEASIRAAEIIERDPVATYTESPEVNVAKIKSYAEKAPVTHVVGQTTVVAILNQKGGVGKSTTAINLSAALGSLDKQVLLIDLDPQGNSSSGLGIERSQVRYCVYDVLLKDLPIEQAIIPDVCKGLDVLPATINLAGAELELASEYARENRLKDAVGTLRGRYDYIFVDCPPSLGLLTVNALNAADKLLIPIQCEYYALEGVTKLLETKNIVQKRLNPSLEIFGVLMTMYDGRTTLSKQVVAEVRNYFGKLVYKSVIPRTVKISEAPGFGLPITEYDPNGKGAKAYLDLAKEVIARG